MNNLSIAYAFEEVYWLFKRPPHLSLFKIWDLIEENENLDYSFPLDFNSVEEWIELEELDIYSDEIDQNYAWNMEKFFIYLLSTFLIFLCFNFSKSFLFEDAYLLLFFLIFLQFKLFSYYILIILLFRENNFFFKTRRFW
jgi:hypothetical protein